jgi:hypothetical protein
MRQKVEVTVRKNSKCRYCQSTKLTRFLSLGDQPPSNSFIQAKQIKDEKNFPLDVYFCETCFLVQLIDVVPGEYIFDDYAYLSSSSRALREHYSELSAILTKRFDLKSGDVVVDIGSNDGILLNGYTNAGLKRIGVEPSSVADIAIAAGFTVIKEFFSKKVSMQIVKKYGKAKIVTATNVFAHVDDITSFVKGLPPLLADDGVFVIEAPYLIDLIDQTLFDTIYHEHLCYLSLTPMHLFLNSLGLEVFDIQRIPFGASGPAIRVFVQKLHGVHPIEKSVKKTLAEEKKWGIGELSTYLGYAKKVEKIKVDVLKLITKIQKKGIHIGGYGAPAKGNTLLNYFELTPNIIECIAENNSIKQGLVTPGTHIPIVSDEAFLENMPEYALLLSWNYLDFFLERSEYIKKGGKFIVPLPKPRIVR